METTGGELKNLLRPEASTTEDPYLVRKGGVLVFTGQAEGDLEAAVQRDRDERESKMTKRDSP